VNRDVILIVQQGPDGPIHISRATQRTAGQAVIKLQAGNPQQLTVQAILLASEPDYLQLLEQHRDQRIRGTWHHPPVNFDPAIARDLIREMQLRGDAHMRTLHDRTTA
jgi:hypothetical protein